MSTNSSKGLCRTNRSRVSAIISLFIVNSIGLDYSRLNSRSPCWTGDSSTSSCTKTQKVSSTPWNRRGALNLPGFQALWSQQEHCWPRPHHCAAPGLVGSLWCQGAPHWGFCLPRGSSRKPFFLDPATLWAPLPHTLDWLPPLSFQVGGIPFFHYPLGVLLSMTLAFAYPPPPPGSKGASSAEMRG